MTSPPSATHSPTISSRQKTRRCCSSNSKVPRRSRRSRDRSGRTNVDVQLRRSAGHAGRRPGGRDADEPVRVPADALFICIGGVPRTDGTAGIGLVTSPAGYLVTGLDAARDPGGSWPLPREPLPLETSRPGVFAAGDVRCGSVKRCAAAIGEGSMAVALVHRRLAEVGGD